MTKEHVWPKWLRDVILSDARGAGRHVWADAEGKPERVARLPLASVQVKRVCATCNQGWMGDLEAAARPLLTRPIQGDPVTLRGDSLLTAATWAYKTALMADLATGGQTRVGPLTHQYLYRYRQPPASVVVLIACYGSARYPLYASAQRPEMEVQVGLRDPVKHHAYLLTISAGHLAFQVFGHHLPQVIHLRPTSWKRNVSRIIWPQPQSVRWPPPVPLNDKTLFRFGRSL